MCVCMGIGCLLLFGYDGAFCCVFGEHTERVRNNCAVCELATVLYYCVKCVYVNNGANRGIIILYSVHLPAVAKWINNTSRRDYPQPSIHIYPTGITASRVHPSQ